MNRIGCQKKTCLILLVRIIIITILWVRSVGVNRIRSCLVFIFHVFKAGVSWVGISPVLA